MENPPSPYFIQINNTGNANLARMLRIPPGSVTVQQAIRMYGHPQWEEFYSFSVIRHPYSRAASIYTSYLYANKYKMLERQVSFITFLNNVIKHKKKPFHDKPLFFRPQWHWLKGYDNELGVEALIKHEKYYDGVFTVLSILGHHPENMVIKPSKEKVSHSWEALFEGIEGKQASDLLRDYWSDDFDNLPYTP